MTDTILVIPDFAPDGAPAASTAELLGAAALVGTPVAVAPANADPRGLCESRRHPGFPRLHLGHACRCRRHRPRARRAGCARLPRGLRRHFYFRLRAHLRRTAHHVAARRQRPPSAGCRAKRRRARCPRASRTPVYHPAPDGSRIDRPPRPRRRLPRRRRRLHRPHRPDRTDRRDRDPRPLYRARYLGRGPTPRRHADLQAHHRCEHRP